MHSDVSGQADRPRILYLQTATNPMFGADAWVLVQIVRYLDRRAHDVVVACHEHVGGRTTPVRASLDDVDDVEFVHCDLGPELSRESGVRMVLAAARSTLALAHLARLAVRLRRRRIDGDAVAPSQTAAVSLFRSRHAGPAGCRAA